MAEQRLALAAADPGKVAIQVVGGAALTYGELHTRSVQAANAMRRLGLQRGDHVAFMLENRCELAVLAWGAQRCGLYFTLIPTHLQAGEAAYIVTDSGARLLVTSRRFTGMWESLPDVLGSIRHCVSVDGAEGAFLALSSWIGVEPRVPIGEEHEGSPMLYSSGTTGRPKGVKRPLADIAFGAEPLAPMYVRHHRMAASTVYLSPAPLYHAAPLRCLLAVNRLGGTVAVMERFDPLQMLHAVQRLRVTHVQLVPTMLVRLLDLPDKVRSSFDLSSLRCVIHAAAPCPVELKQAAIAWLGPIVNEYYGGTEGAGVTYITSAESLTHPGSVGRAIVGEVRVVGEDGREVSGGEVGEVYFANGPRFWYHNAPQKVAEVTNEQGWVSLGDIGRLDAEGYLYLVDRKAFTINSGGVNVYPAESEAILRTHPAVDEAAVFGVPHREFGEEVKAVVQLRQGVAAPTARELMDFCRARISHLKCPRSIDFVDKLPRSEAGKLLKAELKRRYAAAGAAP